MNKKVASNRLWVDSNEQGFSRGGDSSFNYVIISDEIKELKRRNLFYHQ